MTQYKICSDLKLTNPTIQRKSPKKIKTSQLYRLDKRAGTEAIKKKKSNKTITFNNVLILRLLLLR